MIETTPDDGPAIEIEEEARRLVGGDRHDDYGHPFDAMGRVGRLWAAILGVPDISAEQVALCMIAVKIGRQVNRDKRDNLVDLVGYTLTLDLIQRERARRAALPQGDKMTARANGPR